MHYDMGYVRSYADVHRIVILISVFVMVGLLLMISTVLTGYASVGNSSSGKSNINSSRLAALATNSSVLPPPQPKGIVNVGVTPNQLAAGGPLPGNHTMALEEAKCAAGEKNAPWYPTVNPAELADSNRTHVYKCAHFGGSFTGPNKYMHMRLLSSTIVQSSLLPEGSTSFTYWADHGEVQFRSLPDNS